MEYVSVVYEESRAVYIDGVRNGKTNKKLRIGAGTHAFDLGDPQDYQPTRQVVEVSNTTPLAPLIITFHKVQP